MSGPVPVGEAARSGSGPETSGRAGGARLADARARLALPPGHEIDWYRLEEPIGVGGFGITYRARDLRLDVPVAVKEYLPALGVDRDRDHRLTVTVETNRTDFETGLDKFRAEARSLARCRHPNVIGVRALLEANATAYLVMDLEEGDTLRSLIAAGRFAADEERVRGLAHDLMRALQAVHAQDVIHRDVKPANVFVRRRDGRALLLDFGSAREMERNAAHPYTEIVSTGYAPVEQYGGFDQGAWTDVYAAGATLYHAVHGRAPDAAPRRRNAVQAGAPDPLVPLARAAAGRLSPGLLEAIDRALGIEPAERPASIAAWRECFPGDWARRAPTAPAPGGPDPRAPGLEPGYRFRDPVPGGIVVPEVIVVPAGDFRMGAGPEDPDRRPDETPAREVRVAHPFAIAVRPVSQEEYAAYARAAEQRLPRGAASAPPEAPVVNVSWGQARDYSAWLSEATGQRYRLPSEAEWEYAARGGVQTRYWWGDDPRDDPGPAAANAFGVAGMLGEVWEWVADGWCDDLTAVPADATARAAGGDTERVVRGGARDSGPADLRCARRRRHRHGTRSARVGFRVVRELD